jgi:hypothetical protein
MEAEEGRMSEPRNGYRRYTITEQERLPNNAGSRFRHWEFDADGTLAKVASSINRKYDEDLIQHLDEEDRAINRNLRVRREIASLKFLTDRAKP